MTKNLNDALSFFLKKKQSIKIKKLIKNLVEIKVDTNEETEICSEDDIFKITSKDKQN